MRSHLGVSLLSFVLLPQETGVSELVRSHDAKELAARLGCTLLQTSALHKNSFLSIIQHILEHAKTGDGASSIGEYTVDEADLEIDLLEDALIDTASTTVKESCNAAARGDGEHPGYSCDASSEEDGEEYNAKIVAGDGEANKSTSQRMPRRRRTAGKSHACCLCM